MLIKKESGIKVAVLAAWFMLCTYAIFPQDELVRRGSIPEELLRPKRDEAPRYPIDTVIGAMGQGQVSREAYEIAKNIAVAFLAGNINASVLSSVNRVFVESCMRTLNTINPQSYRLGNGREEPDGSFSFLIRFLGREQSITGEVFVRFEEPRSEPKPAEPQPEKHETADGTASETGAESGEEEEPNGEIISVEEEAEKPPPPVQNRPVQKRWLFEDLILEEARSREEENRESRNRFDFSPYERIY